MFESEQNDMESKMPSELWSTVLFKALITVRNGQLSSLRIAMRCETIVQYKSEGAVVCIVISRPIHYFVYKSNKDNAPATMTLFRIEQANYVQYRKFMNSKRFLPNAPFSNGDLFEICAQ